MFHGDAKIITRSIICLQYDLAALKGVIERKELSND
jgi:hypothetical protein